MKKGYTDKTTLENYVLKTIDASFNTQIDAWIEAIETFIDRLTGRNFIADGTASERVYDGNGKIEILIDDCVDIDKVEVDDVEIVEADYHAYPANTVRKYKIKTLGSVFTPGDQNITITAKWGYSVAVPADIKLAATVLLAGIIQYSDKAVRTETIGNYSVSYDSDKGWGDFAQAMKILNSYKKHTF